VLTVDRVAALHRSTMFAAVPGRDLAAVAQAAVVMELAAGTEIITEGTLGDTLYVVVAGRVRVHRGNRTIAELGPGSTVGELAVLVPEARAASVTAVQPTVVLELRKATLDALLADHPDLAMGIIAWLVETVRRTAALHAADDG
jgi:CRP/FNR family transcriptional regulator, cyclic AMP receptor protein